MIYYLKRQLSQMSCRKVKGSLVNILKAENPNFAKPVN